MAVRRDFIERLIQKMAEAIARALGLAKSGATEEGIKAVETAVAAELGMPLPMLLKLTPTTIVSLLGTEKARLLVDALRAHAEMLELAGRPLEARDSRATADGVQALTGPQR
jgi:hypothetical protein